jgi:two-component system, NtrC family, sensor kinase
MDNETNKQVLIDKIDQLNKEAWNIRVSDSTKAHMLSKEAFIQAEDINYLKGKAEGYRTFAFCLIRLSKNQEALDYSEKSLSLFETLNDVNGQSSIYAYYGIIQRNLGNYSASLEFLFRSLELSQQSGNKESEALTSYHLGVTYKYLGDFENALNHLLKSLSISRTHHFWISESYSLNLIGQIYFETSDLSNALVYYHQSLDFRNTSGDKWGEAGCLDNIGIIHYKLNDHNKAIEFCTKALLISRDIKDKKGEANSLFHLGNIYETLSEYTNAATNYNDSLSIRRDIGDKKGETEILLFLSGLYIKENNADRQQKEVFELLNKALQLGQEIKAIDLLAKIHLGFYEAFKHFKRYEESLTHLESHISLSKEIHTDAINQRIQNLETSYKAEKLRKEAEIYRLRNVELVSLYEESKKQKEEIQNTLTELRSTQKQLVQSEKMASLGELTAGIAHEIQNPLNFVNNFSELNKELADELEQEIDKGNYADAKAIAKDIKENEEKINHHGKRADAIVKGMLQHSRSSSGTKEPTDINALADEYLRLAYHGLRAKDKSFNVTINSEFDENIGKINIIPQDIGRVTLNIINNAFYVVDEKAKSGILNYEPTVSVSTKKIADKIWISVKDNGNGIPQKVLDKIFQPFFTTKPTGQGTGLGLSLSYDIVKAHGGEIKVETKEGEGTAFIIQLPS